LLPYRVYLRAELGKLANVDDAKRLLEHMQASRRRFSLPSDPAELADRFASQELVDAYVADLGDSALAAVTNLCSRVRGNDVARKLDRMRGFELLLVGVENVLLSPAELELHDLFDRHGWQLASIARDSEFLTAASYRHHHEREEIRFRWCLAEPWPDRSGMYRIFDGMHRAIQMVRNGETQIPLCAIHR